MHDRPVPDRDVIANRGRMRVVHHVDDRAVLHVGPPPDANAVHVAADDDVHPDAAFGADLDVADDLRAASTYAVGSTTGSRPRYGRSMREL